jgi:hypothetical protein
VVGRVWDDWSGMHRLCEIRESDTETWRDAEIWGFCTKGMSKNNRICVHLVPPWKLVTDS